MNQNNDKDYVSVVYNEKDRPLTNYPQQLSRYLNNRYELKKGNKILDIGCGRGEFLKGFIDCGLDGYAIDQSSTVLNYMPDVKFKTADIEHEGIPFPNSFFDVVYSKSVIEHFHNPEKLIMEMYRVLKPGGIAITLCPSWEYNYKIYFQDYTHRTPFMYESLRDIQLIHGFIEVQVEFFYQLPILWKNKWLIPLAKLTNRIVPDYLKENYKWVKWSKEIMLLSSSFKPV